MAKFMEIKSTNPKLKQSEVDRELKGSSSTMQRYRRETNMLSLYIIPPSSNTNHTKKQKNTNTKLDDVKMTSDDFKMTSNDLKTTSNEPVKYRKNKLKRGEKIEIKGEDLREILHNKHF